MKQRDEIKRELARLRAESHPGDYYEVLQEIVINHLGHEPSLRNFLRALETRYPQEYKDTLSGSTLRRRRRDRAFRLASFLQCNQATGIGKVSWGAKQVPPVDAKILRDDQKIYKEDRDFREEVDGYRELLRQIDP